MRIRLFLAIAALAVAAPGEAQTVKKVGSEVHKALKTTGREVKEAAGDVGSATHKTLTKAGKDVKAEAKRTGVKPVGGDVGREAKRFSRKSKKAGRAAKADVKTSSSKAHGELTKTGKEAKEVVKPNPEKP